MNAHEKAMRSYNRHEGGIYAEEAKDISVVKRRTEGSI